MNLETIDRTGLEQAQKALLPKRDSGLRGGDEQRDFLRLAKEDPDLFCQRLRSWGLTHGETPPVPEEEVSEAEFVDPSWHTEGVIASTWRELPVSLAARPETWTRIHVEMIEQGRIASSYLAAGSRGQTGVEAAHGRLEAQESDEGGQLREDCAAAPSGVIPDRANRTAFMDCPLAKAWWRNRYAQEAHHVFRRDSVEELSSALRPAFRWETLVEDMISRLTVIGDSGIRPALVQCLADGVGSTPRDMRRVRAWIGRRSTVQALGALGPEYVSRLIANEFLGAESSS